MHYSLQPIYPKQKKDQNLKNKYQSIEMELLQVEKQLFINW